MHYTHYIYIDCYNNNISCKLLVCVDKIPSTCEPPDEKDAPKCPDLTMFCDEPWIAIGLCAGTPGLVKDNCKLSCNNCNGKKTLLFIIF